MEQEYVVTLKKDCDPSEFFDQMTKDTSGLKNSDTSLASIPDKPIDWVDKRPGSKRNTEYALSHLEAAELRNDSRVLDVQLKQEILNMPVTTLGKYEDAQFHRTSGGSDIKNWGLRSCSYTNNTDAFGGVNSTSITADHDYALDGTGVDVVIIDTGITAGHPEYTVNPDGTGGSRIQEIDWYTESGISGSQNANCYSDQNGHGSHVAGTAAGNTHGWARGADIYAMATLSNTYAISSYTCFELIRGWHNNKSGPNAGRPTVCNNSWSYYTNALQPVYGTYRGTDWTYEYTGSHGDWGAGSYTGSDWPSPAELENRGIGVSSTHGNFVSSIDADVQDCIDDGIIMYNAAGNNKYVIVGSGHIDYNNWYFDKYYNSVKYYHRGGTPTTSTANIGLVGNVEGSYLSSGGTWYEQTRYSSTKGARLHIWAPGSNIMSPYISGYNDPRNSSYKVTALSGTSMASPQVTGVIACMLQLHPTWTQDDANQWLIDEGIANRLYSTGLDDDYNNDDSICGAPNRYLRMPYIEPYHSMITS